MLLTPRHLHRIAVLMLLSLLISVLSACGRAETFTAATTTVELSNDPYQPQPMPPSNPNQPPCYSPPLISTKQLLLA